MIDSCDGLIDSLTDVVAVFELWEKIEAITLIFHFPLQ